MSRVIIATGGTSDTGYYEACDQDGVTGNAVILRTLNGSHMFSRDDGRWLSGPCLNYRDWRILDESLDAPQTGSGHAWTLRMDRNNQALPLS